MQARSLLPVVTATLAVAVLLLVVAAPVTAQVGPPETATSRDVAVYLLLDQPEAGPYLVPVRRSVPDNGSVAAATVEALLAGPSFDEASGLPQISTAIPPASELRGLHIEDGIADVDLSAAYESGGGSFSMLARLAQVTYTLTRFTSIDRVRFLIEGDPVEVFSNEGIGLDGPIDRTFFDGAGLVPPIFVDNPVWGGDLAHRVRGTASVDEFMLVVTDWDGRVLTEMTVPVTDQIFDTYVLYGINEPQTGSVIVWSAAADGTRDHVREYPVHLTAVMPAPRGVSNACPSVGPLPFADVPAGAPHLEGIGCVYQWKVVSGTGTSTFEPARAATRAQAAAMIARMLEVSGVVLPDPGGATLFADAQASVHRNRIEQLARIGVVTGTGEGLFEPERRVTRAQFAAMLHRAAEVRIGPSPTVIMDRFTDDAGSVHERAINAIADLGIVGGIDGVRFAPEAEVTRGQAATMLARFLDLLVEEGLVPA